MAIAPWWTPGREVCSSRVSRQSSPGDCTMWPMEGFDLWFRTFGIHLCYFKNSMNIWITFGCWNCKINLIASGLVNIHILWHRWTISPLYLYPHRPSSTLLPTQTVFSANREVTNLCAMGTQWRQQWSACRTGSCVMEKSYKVQLCLNVLAIGIWEHGLFKSVLVASSFTTFHSKGYFFLRNSEMDPTRLLLRHLPDE